MSGIHKWRKHAVVAVGLAMFGCATASQLFPLDYTYIDQPDHKRVEVRYRNTGLQGLCVLPDHWPNQGGKIDQNGDAVFLIVDGRKFSLRPFNTGYCPGGCATYVPPGREIVSFISYRDFALPADLEVAGKRLELAAWGYSCRRPKGADNP